MALSKGFVRNAATTPKDARLMDKARFVRNSDGTTRTGVLSDGSTLVTALASMNVQVAAGEFVLSKGAADGAVVLANDGGTNVAISAAPVSNSRITSIWVKHNDDETGDANATPVFGTTDGAAAATPVAPAIPTGALELAQLRVYSGTTAANGGSNTLTQTYRMTAARGGIVPFRTLADLTAWTTAMDGQVATVLNEQGGPGLYRYDGSDWRAVSSLLGVTSVTPATQSGIGAVEVDVTDATITVDVPRAGAVRISGSLQTYAAASDTVAVIRVKEGSTTLRGFTRMANSSPSIAATSATQTFSFILPAVTKGTHTYKLAIARAAGTGGVAVAPGATAPTELVVELV